MSDIFMGLEVGQDLSERLSAIADGVEASVPSLDEGAMGHPTLTAIVGELERASKEALDGEVAALGRAGLVIRFRAMWFEEVDARAMGGAR